VSDIDSRAKLYAHAESHRIGVEIASGPRRSDAEYKLLFEEMLASAFRIGYAAGAEAMAKESAVEVYRKRERKL